MRIPRIYINQEITENQELFIEGSTYRYLATVLRMKVGRKMTLFNGKGYEYSASISEVTKKQLVIQVQSAVLPQIESSLSIELACCLIKNDRMDWLLQKATELGVASITPLYSEYTDVSLSKERLQKKMQHWQKIIVSACEQSGRVRVPVVAEPRDILEWISEVKADIKTLLHPYHSQPISTLSQYQNKVKSLALLVGPEGGLKDSEVDHGMHHQFISLGLGPRILRAETAPLAAIAIMQSVLGDG